MKNKNKLLIILLLFVGIFITTSLSAYSWHCWIPGVNSDHCCDEVGDKCCEGPRCAGSNLYCYDPGGKRECRLESPAQPTPAPPPPPPPCQARESGCYAKINEPALGGNLARDQFDYFLPDNKCLKTDSCGECPTGSDKDITEVRDADQLTLACSCISPSAWNEQVQQNKKCCGDDIDDCGYVNAPGGGLNGAICNIDTANSKAEWMISSTSLQGDIKYIPCSRAEYLATGNSWKICDGTFWKETVKGHDYICQGRGQGGIVECCGNGQCNSVSAGERRNTGESLNSSQYTGGQQPPLFAEVSVSHSPSSIPSSATPVTVTATASTSNGLSKIEIFVDGISIKTCTSGTSCSRARTYEAGEHYYYAEATYAAGNVRAPNSGTESFTVGECKAPDFKLIGNDCVPSCGAAAGPNAKCLFAYQQCPAGYEQVFAVWDCNVASVPPSKCCKPTGYTPSGTQNPNPPPVWGGGGSGDGDHDDEPLEGDVVASDFITGNVVSITGFSSHCPSGCPPPQLTNCGANQQPDCDLSSCTWKCVPTGQAGTTYYCGPDGKFYTTLNQQQTTTTLGGSTATPANLRETCQKAGFTWTGSKCCGEPSDRPEYYNDLATAASGATTSSSSSRSAQASSSCGQVTESAVLAILRKYNPTNEGITQVLPELKSAFGSQVRILDHPERLDKIDFGNGYVVDVIASATGTSGTWGWNPETSCSSPITGNAIRDTTGNAAGDCTLGAYAGRLSGFPQINDCNVQTVKYKAGRVFTAFNPSNGVTTEVINALKAAGLNPAQLKNDEIEFSDVEAGIRVGSIDVITDCCGPNAKWAWGSFSGGAGSSGSGEGGLGGCWNSKAVMSIGFVEGTQNSIVNYKGQFYGCAIDKNNYNKENDAALSLRDSHAKGQLVNNKNYCDLLPDKSYYCSYTEKWLQTEGKDRSHFSQTPMPNAQQRAECCAKEECWNGESCIGDQSNDPLAKSVNDFLCIKGNWAKQNKVCTPDGSLCGYCQPGKCLASVGGKTQCIETGQYTGDSYCESGDWSSRTKLLALKLLSMKSGDYVLFCDDRENALNNLQYITESNEVVANVLTNLKTNNFCVLKFGGKIIAATSTDRNYEEVPGGLNIFGVTSCSAATDNGQYVPCSSSNKVWYNKRLKSYIYSATPLSVPANEISFADFIRNPINAIIEAIRRLIIPGDQSSLMAMKKFDRLYMAQYSTQQGIRSVTGSIEGENPSSAVMEYSGFTEDICKFVEQFSKTKAQDLSRISCKKENTKYYVFAQGSEFTNLNPNSIWPDLTSKLRLK